MSWTNFSKEEKDRILKLVAQSKKNNYSGPPTFNQTSIPNQRKLFLQLKNDVEDSSFKSNGVKLDLDIYRPQRNEVGQRHRYVKINFLDNNFKNIIFFYISSHENIMLRIGLDAVDGLNPLEKLINSETGLITAFTKFWQFLKKFYQNNNMYLYGSYKIYMSGENFAGRNQEMDLFNENNFNRFLEQISIVLNSARTVDFTSNFQ